MGEITIPYKSRKWADLLHSSTKRWNVLVLHRRAGKTTAALNHLQRDAIRIKESRYAYIAPTYKMAKFVAWDMVKKYSRVVPNIDYNEAELTVRYPNNSKLTLFGAEDPNRLRGLGFNGVALDEYSQQPSNIFSEVISKTLADKLGYAIWIGTPQGKNEFYRIYNESKNNEDFLSLFRTIDDTLRDEEGETIDNLRVALEDDRKLVNRGLMTEDEFQQEWYCFPDFTPIITFNGLKQIKDIKVGEFVLTHTNRWRKVLNVLIREYNGELIKVYSFGNYREPIICTPEHPIRICEPSKQKYQWKKAKDIKKGEFIVYPKIIGNKIISEELAEIIAWFIAEGSTDKNRVNFTLNKKEVDYIADICYLAQKLGYKVKRTYNKNCCNIRIADTKLVDFLQTNCGSGAENKKIPFNLIGGYEKLVYKILINGDGCRIKNKKEVFDSFTTISKILAYQFQLLTHSLGKTAGITKRKNQNNIILGRKCDVQDSYNVQVRKGGLKLINTKYSVIGKIDKIEKENYIGNVYNLTTQYDNSYTAFGREVHNCSFEASIKGSYYSKELAMARAQGRIKLVPYDKQLLVHTAWDLGVGENIAVGFFQRLHNELRLIDYWEGTNDEGISYAISIVKNKGYTYGKHFAPHDIEAKELMSGKSRKETAGSLGLEFSVVPKLSVDDGINAVRIIFPRLWISEQTCKYFIDAISQYRREWNDKMGMFNEKPLHDWTSHSADMLRYAAISENEMVNEFDSKKVLEIERIKQERKSQWMT